MFWLKNIFRVKKQSPFRTSVLAACWLACLLACVPACLLEQIHTDNGCIHIHTCLGQSWAGWWCRVCLCVCVCVWASMLKMQHAPVQICLLCVCVVCVPRNVCVCVSVHVHVRYPLCMTWKVRALGRSARICVRVGGLCVLCVARVCVGVSLCVCVLPVCVGLGAQDATCATHSTHSTPHRKKTEHPEQTCPGLMCDICVL